MPSYLWNKRPVLTILVLVPVILGGFTLGVMIREAGLSTASATPTRTPVPTGGGSTPDRKYSFSDIFNYSSIADLQAAGWQLCGGGAPLSQYSIGGGLLTLYNDGVTGAGVCRQDVPKAVSNWIVSARIEWVGNSVGSLGLSFRTTTHNYFFQADGYYSRFDFQRDGQYQPPTLTGPSYTPQFNTLHTMSAMMSRGTLTMYFDGTQVMVYNELGKTNLQWFGIFAQYQTYDATNFISVASI